MFVSRRRKMERLRDAAKPAGRQPKVVSDMELFKMMGYSPETAN